MPTLQELEQNYSKSYPSLSLGSKPNNQNQDLSTGQALEQGFSNFGSSLGSNIRGIGESFLHPIDTVKSLGQLAYGAVSPQYAGGDLGKNGKAIPVNQSPQTQSFNKFGQNFAGGSLAGKGYQGLKQKLAKDPVGLLLDLSMLGEGASQVINQVHDLALSPKLAEISKIAGNPAQAPFETMGSALEKLGQPKAGALDNLNNAQEMGIEKPPIQMLSNNPIIKMASNYVSTGLFGGKLTDALNSAKEILNNKSNELIGELPKSIDNPTLGKNIIAAKDNFEKAFNQKVDTLYNDFTDKFGSAPATTENTLQAIEKQIDQLRQSANPGNDTMVNRLTDLKNNLIYGSEKSAQVTKALADQGKVESQIGIGEVIGSQLTPQEIKQRLGITYEPTFNTLKATRTDIGALVGKDNPNSYIYRPIYAALSKDREASLNTINPEAAGKIKQIDAYYKGTLEKLGTDVSNKIDNAQPEQIVKNLVSGNNSTTLNALKDVIDKQTFANIGLSWMKDVLNKSTDNVTGKLDINKFISNVKGLDEPTKNALFTPEQIQRLNETTDTLGKVQKLQDMISKNANAGAFMRNSMILRAMGLPVVMAMGGSTAILTYITGMLGGEFIGSKLFNSPLGKSLLATGSEGLVNTGKTVKNVGEVTGKLSKIANLKQEQK